ncbi:hypothetical protein AAHE18_19G163700 [Arachis hypogaea]
MRSSCRIELGEFDSFFILDFMTCLIALMAMNIKISTNRLCSRKAFLSLTTLSSSVLQEREANTTKSKAHCLSSYSPFLPWPPPLPPQLSSSAGRATKFEGDLAINGGTSQVFAWNPYERLPN